MCRRDQDCIAQCILYGCGKQVDILWFSNALQVHSFEQGLAPLPRNRVGLNCQCLYRSESASIGYGNGDRCAWCCCASGCGSTVSGSVFTQYRDGERERGIPLKVFSNRVDPGRDHFICAIENAVNVESGWHRFDHHHRLCDGEVDRLGSARITFFVKGFYAHGIGAIG